MGVLRDAGDAAKGDQRGRKGGSKGKDFFLFHRNFFNLFNYLNLQFLSHSSQSLYYFYFLFSHSQVSVANFSNMYYVALL